MNKKLFLIGVTLLALLAGFFATSGLGGSSTVIAQEQVTVSRFILVAAEPAVRMWSGPIQFSDNNSPDFRPHTILPLKQGVTSDCISEESTNPRRWGGCIQ